VIFIFDCLSRNLLPGGTVVQLAGAPLPQLRAAAATDSDKTGDWPAHIVQTFFFGRRKPAIHFAKTNCLHCSHLVLQRSLGRHHISPRSIRKRFPIEEA
jgi:hypothetical protein